jgi:uncharacterized membrane protein YcgQ (UPF0703/DUF1980 family)
LTGFELFFRLVLIGIAKNAPLESTQVSAAGAQTPKPAINPTSNVTTKCYLLSDVTIGSALICQRARLAR